MESEWITKKVDRIALINTDTYSPKENWGFVNYLDTGNITEGAIEGIHYVSNMKLLPSRARRKIERGDIVYSTVRPNQRHYGIISDPPKNMLISTGFAVLRGIDGICDTNFLYYFLTQHKIVEYLQAVAEHSTSAYPSIRPSDIGSLEIDLPPFPEQHAIAHVLGTFDDKIELNRQMNATLEAMARAIFKSWFVDFDPVRAKMEGEEPAGMDAETAALFPDKFEEVDGREVPAGWRVGSLTDVVDILGGGTPKTTIEKYWGGQIPWFSVVDAPDTTDVFVIDTERRITELALNNSSARILPVGTTIITARGTVGKTALTAVSMAMNQSCYGLLGKDGYGPFFTYFLTRSVVSILRQNVHGSVFDTITRQTLKNTYVTIPLKEVCEAFERQVGPLLKSIESNVFESRTLAALRDTLLPKLISGEIQINVKEAFHGS